MLHERVRDENPERGEIARERDEPDRHAVRTLGETVPAEEPDTEHRRFKEKGSECLERERRAEDIAHEAGILRPVHTEVELLHDAGDDAHGEIDDEQRAEKLHELPTSRLPCRTPRPYIARLQERYEHGKAERHGDEEEVVDRCDGKLPSGQEQCFHRIPSLCVKR